MSHPASHSGSFSVGVTDISDQEAFRNKAGEASVSLAFSLNKYWELVGKGLSPQLLGTSGTPIFLGSGLLPTSLTSVYSAEPLVGCQGGLSCGRGRVDVLLVGF